MFWGVIEEQAERLHQQEELIGQLKDEIGVLKGEKKRPRFKPSGMEEKAGQEEEESEVMERKRPGSEKRTKTRTLEIHEERKIAKVTGGTRSDLGRRCRDTFASLKKTCHKLRLSFWQFIIDRVFATNAIPPLPSLIHQAAVH